MKFAQENTRLAHRLVEHKNGTGLQCSRACAKVEHGLLLDARTNNMYVTEREASFSCANEEGTASLITGTGATTPTAAAAARPAPFCLMSVLAQRSFTFAPPLRAGPLKNSRDAPTDFRVGCHRLGRASDGDAGHCPPQSSQ